MAPRVAAGHITAAPYFQAVDSAVNRDCLRRFRSLYGDEVEPNMCWEAAYFQVHLFAQAMQRSGSDDLERLLPHLLGSEFDAPQGRVRIDPATHHTRLYPRIGRVGDTEHYRNDERHAVQCTPGVLALRIDESLIFTNARRLPDLVTQHLQALPDTRRVVLLMSPVNRIDLSGLAALRALHDALAARGIRLDLTEVKGPVLDALKAGALDSWFRGRVYLSHHQGMVDAAP